ncbi:MAG: hypothetical protein COA42_15285 [Alteromonadaceae bacterium]|nr:MAG: hypothetical protein COA42_15285 [Alteromonadaceae bacterium]
MAYENYSQLRVLVVDDFMQFLTSIKRMLEELGVVKIDIALSSSQALQFCDGPAYDVVLCDYNLGDDVKNGLHVLEAIREKRAIRHHTMFVLVTAETSKEVVLATYDEEPDAYLTKPFNYKMLYQRLNRILLRRDEMKPVFSALEKNELKQAIQCCEKKSEMTGRFQVDFKKLLCDLYLKNKNYDLAEMLLKKVLDERPLDWAKISYARVKVALGEFEVATDNLKDLIRSNKFCLQAYDILIDVYEATGETEKKQKILKEVTDVSPLSILRQKRLGEVAQVNNDMGTAATAYLRCVQVGKHSCHKAPEDYMELGRTTAAMLAESNGDMERHSQKTLEALSGVSSQFGSDSNRDTQLLLVQSRIYSGLKNETKSVSMLKKAEELIRQNSDILDVKTKLDWAQAISSNGEKERADKLLRELVMEYQDDEKALSEIDKHLAEPKSKANRMKIASINREGVGFYNDKKYAESINLFKYAARLFPKHVGIRLNLVQAILGDLEAGDRTLDRRGLCLEILNSVSEEIPDSDRQGVRYAHLRDKFDKLERLF